MGPNPVRKLSKPGHRHVMAWGGEMAVYKPGTGTWNMSFLHSPQKEPTLPFKCLCINLRHFLDLPQFLPPSPGGTACSSVSKQRPSKPTLFCSASGLVPFDLEQKLGSPPTVKGQSISRGPRVVDIVPSQPQPVLAGFKIDNTFEKNHTWKPRQPALPPSTPGGVQAVR